MNHVASYILAIPNYCNT